MNYTSKFELNEEIEILTMKGIDVAKITKREKLINLDNGNEEIYYTYKLTDKNTIERDTEELITKLNSLAEAYKNLPK